VSWTQRYIWTKVGTIRRGSNGKISQKRFCLCQQNKHYHYQHKNLNTKTILWSPTTVTLHLKPKAKTLCSADVMTQRFSRSVAATMLLRYGRWILKVGYLMQGEIFNVYNFVNAYLWQLSCSSLLSVHHNESTNMLINVIFWFGGQLKFDLVFQK